MPSWSASNPSPEKVATPTGTVAATAAERARRLLEQLLASVPRDDQPPRPKQ